MTAALWQREFGKEYAIPSEVLALVRSKHAVDMSYHNDVCPSVGVCDEETGDDALRIFVEHPDPSQREAGNEAARFYVIAAQVECLYSGDDVAMAVKVYEAARFLILNGCSITKEG